MRWLCALGLHRREAWTATSWSVNVEAALAYMERGRPVPATSADRVSCSWCGRDRIDGLWV